MQKKVLLKVFFSLIFVANFIFVVPHLKIHPAVYLNTSKALSHCSQKEKFIKSLLAFIILTFKFMLKNDKMIAEWLDVQNRTVYSDIFRHVQGHSALFSHLQIY